MKTWAEIDAKKYGEIAMSMVQAANLNLKDFVEEPYPPSFRIVHQPTQDYFAFGGEDGGAMWTRPGHPGNTSQTGRGNLESWEAKIRHFEGWLGQLQELLAAIEEHSKYEQIAPPVPDLPQSSTAARHAAGDRAETARNEIGLPSELTKPMGEMATGKDMHLDLLEMILKRKTTTLEKWARGHKLGRTTVFDWKSCRRAGKSSKSKVSGEKSAEIQTAIEDDAAELGLTTRTDSD